MTATGQVLAGRYTLIRWVGGGSMGEVWEATDTRMDLPVAVKVLRPDHVNDPVALERFRIEAKLGAKLDHPGIAKVRDVNVEPAGEEPPWMVQEFVAGEPLTALLNRSGPLEPGRAASIVAQAAEAAGAAHEVGIVHRDLTPRNLLVTPDDVVKVTDFGIARSEAVTGLTKAGLVIGTPAYLSPEQVRGHPASPASDVYTLAVVLYECLSGARPFDGRTPIEVARAHLDQEPPPLPPTVPAGLRALVDAGLDKNPARRLGAADFAHRLRAAVPGPPAATRTLPPVRVTPPPAATRSAGARPTPAPVNVPAPAATATRLPDRARAAVAERWRIIEPVLEQARQRCRRLLDDGAELWVAHRPGVLRAARVTRQRVLSMRLGLAGVAVLLLAVLAVLSSGNG
jgi:eukaryotic-like serine/threonine-protein kinase